MDDLRSGYDLIDPGETGLFICTDGLNQHLDTRVGTGSSGWWKLDPERPVDRVFIFRKGKDAETPSEVFSGRRVRAEGPDGGRYCLHLEDVRREGTTRLSWSRFAEAGENPIRYLSRDDGGGRSKRKGTRGLYLTAAQVLRLFDTFQFDHDDRQPPDGRRQGKFREGWADAAERQEVYSKGTLTRLTWQNLGYRFGGRLGPRTSVEVDTVFDHLARHFDVLRPDGLVALPGEIDGVQGYREGAVCQVMVNAYERNRKARRECIDVID